MLHRRTRPRAARAPKAGAASAALCAALAACQTYEPAPVDLEAHREAFEARALRAEPLGRFCERLGDAGADVPPRFDPADGLSAAEGEVLALFHNADLRLARRAAGVAEAARDASGLWQDPVFGFQLAQVLSPGDRLEWNAVPTLSLPVSGRLGASVDQADAALAASLARVVDQEWSLRARVRAAWAAWSAAKERVALLGDVDDRAQRVGAIADGLVAAGELSRIEARLVQAQLVQIRAEIAEAELAETTARIAVLDLCGLPAAPGVVLVPGFRLDAPPRGDDDVDRLLATSTALAARRAEYEVAEQTLRREIREQVPDVTFGFGPGSEERDDRLLFTGSIPIPVLNANRLAIARARARREEARVALEAELESATRRVSLARAALEAVQRQRSAIEGDLVPLLDEQAREVERLAELGELDTFVLLETIRQSYGAKRRALELMRDEAAAAADLARLMGPPRPAAPAPGAEAVEAAARSPHAAPEEDRR